MKFPKHLTFQFSILTVMLLAGIAGSAQKVLFLGGTAHIGNGEVIKNAAVGIENGRFLFVENQMFRRIDTAEFDSVIRLRDVHYYPGFIAANTTLGLTEIDAVRASRDFKETGRFNPNVRTLTAFNTDSDIIPTVRSNGVLIAQATPRGGKFSGTSSIMNLQGRNWEEAALKVDDGIHLNWPERFSKKGWWANPGSTNRNSNEKEQIEAVIDFLNEALAYAQKEKSNPVNLRFEAMRGVFNGKKILYVHCNQARSIVKAASLKRRFNIPNLVIVGGYDAHLIPEVLIDNAIPVIYKRPLSLPSRDDDDVHLPFKIPAKLQSQNILFCIDMSGGMEAMNQRNLPFAAGAAAAYGLEKEQALAAITGNAAKILGIDEESGTLQTGKYATFFISKGDALEIKTNQIIRAYINGKPVELSNRQTRLRDKFQPVYE